MTDRKTFRCAIYTRKSSEEGLEQDFNSLEAQREACEAYIQSQSREGWKLIPTAFDDGGFSGGNMQRPGLTALMDLVKAGKVDIIVVYKIDRLTRSLTDFAKLADEFDKRGVSFVSVTQQFNTTTSMGRLMLNVLLSFAQFEREITGERIRDKIAASKKKGMWMGGNVPIGYSVVDRRLLVHSEEAKTVRRIFELYLEEGSVPALLHRLEVDGLRTAERNSASGRGSGLRAFTRGHLYKLLSNPIYIGRIAHGAQSYPGQHEAIVYQATWSAVQTQLGDNTQGSRRRGRRPAAQKHFLSGLVFSERSNRLIPTHASKGKRRYRYYVEEPTSGHSSSPPKATPSRYPAAELEAAVLSGLASALSEPRTLLTRFEDIPSHDTARVLRAAVDLGNTLSTINAASTELARALLQRVVCGTDRLNLVLSGTALLRRLGVVDHQTQGPFSNQERDWPIDFTAPLSIRRRGVQMKLVVDGPQPQRRVDRAQLDVVARAQTWRHQLTSGQAQSIAEIAEREGLRASYVGQLLPLGFLAPKLVEAIISGHQPAELSASDLIWKREIADDWERQIGALAPNLQRRN